MKQKFHFWLLLFLCMFMALELFSTNIHLSINNFGQFHPFHEGLFFDSAKYSVDWYVDNQNADGIIDYAIYFDDFGQKLFEVQDYNNDGYMDDFYFYEDGVLIRQEVDQNSDQRIDLWVYVLEGVYIEGYERDSDYDGRIDIIKLYNEE